MRALFHVPLLAGLILAAPSGLAATAAFAQNQPPPFSLAPLDEATPEAGPESEGARPSENRHDENSSKTATEEPDRAKRLDALFAALKSAPDSENAKGIAQRIELALAPSGSDTADLLMARATIAAHTKDYDLAIQLLDGVLTIAPDHLDAWNKRATVFYQKQDFADALVDLRQVVTREPRHYNGWVGIAIILKDIGDEKHALEAVRRALAIYPHLGEVDEMEKELSLSVEGRPI